ncbi:MAG: ArsA family ATPase [Candidatus Rokubacteria bacterium]|nr:ArsA family ATPase [Candidatus Rokubacteria bacterium]
MKLILFGGKGGVGKTTCASAAAVQLADAGCRTLLVSADPAHSLSDSLEHEIGPEVQKMEGVENLSALEISAERLFLKFKEEHGEEIKRILETGTYLDEGDLDDLFSLSIPGLDEVMALMELVELMDRGEYDFHILDTAPTGHALRLLALPELLDEWIRVLARMRYKYRYVVSRLARREIHEPADDFLFTMKRTVRKIQGLLRDPGRCEFVVVTIPETMAIAETQRLVEELGRMKIPVRCLVVNRMVSSERGACPFCHERWQEQRGLLQKCERAFPQLTIFKLLEHPHQVKGLQRLRGVPLPVQWFSADPVVVTERGLE